MHWIGHTEEYFAVCYQKRKLKQEITKTFKEGKDLSEVQNYFNFKINQLNQLQDYNEDFIKEALIELKKDIEKDEVKIKNRKSKTRQALLEKTHEDLISIIQEYEPTDSYTKTIHLLHQNVLEKIDKIPTPKSCFCNIL